MALTGDDSQEKREQAVERLVLDAGEDKLDYIFTVDIFNEGVDVPEGKSSGHAPANGITYCICTAVGAWSSESGRKRICGDT